MLILNLLESLKPPGVETGFPVQIFACVFKFILCIIEVNTIELELDLEGLIEIWLAKQVFNDVVLPNSALVN